MPATENAFEPPLSESPISPPSQPSTLPKECSGAALSTFLPQGAEGVNPAKQRDGPNLGWPVLVSELPSWASTSQLKQQVFPNRDCRCSAGSVSCPSTEEKSLEHGMTMPPTKQLQGVLNASYRICLETSSLQPSFCWHWLFSQQVLGGFYVSFSFQEATGMEFHFKPQSISITT